jgi:hypothetical protein
METWIDPDLARVFAFDAVDVAANRSGLLSPDQEVMCAASSPRRSWSRRARPGDATRWRVFTVEGHPITWPTTSGDAVVSVGGVEFVVEGGDAFLFDAERVHRVHWTPDATRRPAILSIEVRDPLR